MTPKLADIECATELSDRSHSDHGGSPSRKPPGHENGAAANAVDVDSTPRSPLSSQLPVGLCGFLWGGLPVPLFYYLGVVTLIHWNVVLSFMPIFSQGLYKGVHWLGGDWGEWVPLCYAVATNIMLAVTTSRSVAARLGTVSRLYAGCLVSVVSILGLLACDRLLQDADKDFAMLLGLTNVVILGIGSSLLQGSIFGMAGSISPRLSSAVMVGQGAAGVASGVVGLPLGDSRTAAAICMVVSSLAALVVPPLFRHVALSNSHLRRMMLPAAERDGTPLAAQRDLPPATPMSHRSSANITRDAWPQAFSVWFVFLVTFVVFPGVTLHWTPAEHAKVVLAVFQFMDIAGRSCAEAERFRVTNGRTVSLMSLSRIVFVPMFMAVQRADGEWARSLWVKVPLMSAFSFTNGYVSTLSMMIGPVQKGVAEHEREFVGTLMSFGVVHGILWGSMLALTTQLGI